MTHATRVAHIRKTRTFEKLADGTFRARWLNSDGVTDFTAPIVGTFDAVKYGASSRFGHFNYQDETDTFREILEAVRP
jgi:hypothetical protein